MCDYIKNSYAKVFTNLSFWNIMCRLSIWLSLVTILITLVYFEVDATPIKSRKQFRRLQGNSVLFIDCGSMYDILQLSIDGCHEVPCKLELGKVVTVNSEYNDHGESDHVLKHDVYWVLNAVNTKAFVTPEACEGVLCPFRGFEGMAFAANLFVNDTLPALPGQLYWEVYNESDELVMCYKIPIAITF